MLLILCFTWAVGRVSVGFWAGSKAISSKLSKPRPVAFNSERQHVIRSLTANQAPPKCCRIEISSWQVAHRTDNLPSPFAMTVEDDSGTKAKTYKDVLPVSLAVVRESLTNQHLLHQTPARSSRALSVNTYAYSFWRYDVRGGGLAPARQYGGGQSGLITTIGIGDRSESNRPPKLSALFRSSIAHQNLRDRELAVGLRWQPAAKWPIFVSAERRFQGVGHDNSTFYVAGGLNNIALAAKFKLEAYAQGGMVTGENAGLFFDGQIRADRLILPKSPVPVYLGSGLWTGGQRNAARLDIGPSLRTEVPIGKARIRLTADWRFRIAGDAAPGDGPALTLSTGF